MTSELSDFSNLRTFDQRCAGRPTTIRFYADVVVTEKSGWPWRRRRTTRLRAIMRDGWDGLWRFVHDDRPVPSQEHVHALEAVYLHHINSLP